MSNMRRAYSLSGDYVDPTLISLKELICKKCIKLKRIIVETTSSIKYQLPVIGRIVSYVHKDESSLSFNPDDDSTIRLNEWYNKLQNVKSTEGMKTLFKGYVMGINKDGIDIYKNINFKLGKTKEGVNKGKLRMVLMKYDYRKNENKKWITYAMYPKKRDAEGEYQDKQILGDEDHFVMLQEYIGLVPCTTSVTGIRSITDFDCPS